MCTFFCVHNGWRHSAGDVFLGGPSIILIGPLQQRYVDEESSDVHGIKKLTQNERCINFFINIDNTQKQHYPYEQKGIIIWILLYYIFSYCTWATMLSTSYQFYDQTRVCVYLKSQGDVDSRGIRQQTIVNACQWGFTLLYICACRLQMICLNGPCDASRL